MNRVTGLGRRGGLTAAGLLLAAACLALAGCKTTGKQMPEEESQWINPFEPKTFKEEEAILPALPQDANLIPFSVNGTGNLTFEVDSKSVSVGNDKVVRFTVVISSSTGARNVNYEGLRCDAFERRIYATLPAGAKEWEVNRGESRDSWIRMQTSARNAYAATLASDFFCEGRTVAGTPEKMVRDLKDSAPHRR
ncbi:CNP1-like family protein [Cupriavidus numazuensis]|uniref:CNP1-like uncharacterized domain-containing protein n=1 Tax=Cupriavidus numazuensis TaxID=221992 RepID=A0ABN7Q1F0_9BURK|nr:CNP1-like family protein [Cupriavidus numazuensis]CAG2152808.1 hypothetical protein LMG26411_04271 [Cupriavidus numazuensis]